MRIPRQSLPQAVARRFEGIVSARVADAGERRRQAGLLAALVAGGLGAALLLPVATFSGGTAHAVAAAGLSSLCLGLAATLAATAAFDAVIAAGVASAAMLIGLAAVFDGGSASPLMLLLPIAPVEALASDRRQLFRTCFGIASLGIGFVFAASAAGIAAPPGALDAPAVATALLLCLYGTARAPRLWRAVVRRSVPAASELPGFNRLRFAPDGALLEASPEATRAFGDRLGADDRLPFALSLVHVADRVRYLAAFGEIRAGAADASCDVRVWNAVENGFSDAGVRLRAMRRGTELVAIETATAEATATGAPAATNLEAALEAARAGSEAKSNFVAMVSHELRTPLNAIIGFSDVLDRELFGSFADPRQKEYVGLIRQSGEHLLSVVNGLLDVSKIEAGRYELVTERFDIADVLEPALATVRCEAERKGLRLDCRNDCADGAIVADRRAVHQILLNLVANAVKFTEEGGIEVRVSEADGAMRITVSDTGIGIPAADIPRLGQPFTQGSSGLTRRYPGTGLGLSLVKGFAELHGGTLTIASEPGRGTTVSVTMSLDGARAVLQNEANQKIVSLKHARSTEAHVPSFEARRSA